MDDALTLGDLLDHAEELGRLADEAIARGDDGLAEARDIRTLAACLQAVANTITHDDAFADRVERYAEELEVIATDILP